MNVTAQEKKNLGFTWFYLWENGLLQSYYQTFILFKNWNKFSWHTNLLSTFEWSRSVLHACNTIWNEAKALSICFPHWHSQHSISVYRISTAVINVGSLQPAICSGDKMSCSIASNAVILKWFCPVSSSKRAKQSGKLALQGTSFFAFSVPFLSLSSKLAILFKISSRWI